MYAIGSGRHNSMISGPGLIGGRCTDPPKHLGNKVILYLQAQISKNKDNTPLQPQRLNGASLPDSRGVSSQHQRRRSLEPVL